MLAANTPIKYTHHGDSTTHKAPCKHSLHRHWHWLPTHPPNIPTMETPQLTRQALTAQTLALAANTPIKYTHHGDSTTHKASTHCTDTGTGCQHSHQRYPPWWLHNSQGKHSPCHWLVLTANTPIKDTHHGDSTTHKASTHHVTGWCWLPTLPSKIPTMVTPQLTRQALTMSLAGADCQHSHQRYPPWWLHNSQARLQAFTTQTLALAANTPIKYTQVIQHLTRTPASTHHTDIGAGSQHSHPNIVSKVDICQNLKASGITNVHLENGALQIQSTVKCHRKPQCLPPAKPLDTICTRYGTYKKCP